MVHAKILDTEIANAIAELGKRTDHLEHIHPNMDATVGGVVGSVYGYRLYVAVCIVASAAIAFGIVKYLNNKKA